MAICRYFGRNERLVSFTAVRHIAILLAQAPTEIVTIPINKRNVNHIHPRKLGIAVCQVRHVMHSMQKLPDGDRRWYFSGVFLFGDGRAEGHVVDCDRESREIAQTFV
ncbi:hypothetical protein MTP99_013383 [Tenebrio molitor]|jgi:hypothetical protein|nr:hypothetical protein MTP99_013383 [Tenebrio molitor]